MEKPPIGGKSITPRGAHAIEALLDRRVNGKAVLRVR
jgi:hypothetical protein